MIDLDQEILSIHDPEQAGVVYYRVTACLESANSLASALRSRINRRPLREIAEKLRKIEVSNGHRDDEADPQAIHRIAVKIMIEADPYFLADASVPRPIRDAMLSFWIR